MEMTEKRYTITLGKNNEFKEIIDHCRQDKHISVIQFLKQVGEQDKAFKKLKKENKELKKQREELFIRERNIKNELRELKKENKEIKENVGRLISEAIVEILDGQRYEGERVLNKALRLLE